MVTKSIDLKGGHSDSAHAEISLTQGMVALVDAEWAHLAQFRWQAHRNSSGDRALFYASRADRDGATGKRSTVWMHRVITGAEGLERVDHINGDTLDNRSVNLRKVTSAENAQNRHRAPSHSKLKVRGVSWDPSQNKYLARVKVNRRIVWRRRFKTIAEATEAVAEARRRFMTHSSESTPNGIDMEGGYSDATAPRKPGQATRARGGDVAPLVVAMTSRHDSALGS